MGFLVLSRKIYDIKKFCEKNKVMIYFCTAFNKPCAVMRYVILNVEEEVVYEN